MSAATPESPGTARLAATILIVDDAPDMRFLTRALIERAGLHVLGEAQDGPSALECLRELGPPTVVLLDNQMPGPSGLEVAAEILARDPHQLILLFSAVLSEQTLAEASRVGIAACLSKSDVIKVGTVLADVVAMRP